MVLVETGSLSAIGRQRKGLHYGLKAEFPRLPWRPELSSSALRRWRRLGSRGERRLWGDSPSKNAGRSERGPRQDRPTFIRSRQGTERRFRVDERVWHGANFGATGWVSPVSKE